MKKIFVALWVLLFVTTPISNVKAQDPITLIIKEGITKVIKAVDLKIQRLQNNTIWLQNLQKELENKMSRLKLDEITHWVEKQRTLYKDYYEELWKVKNMITVYHRIKEVTENQVALVQEYKRVWALFKKDRHFSADELLYMSKVYYGILEESLKSIDQLFLVANSFTTQMSDAKRLEIINKAADGIQTAYSDLKAFNQQNIRLSLQRAKGAHDVDILKQLYGIQ